MKAATVRVADPGAWVRRPVPRSMAEVRYEPAAPPIRPDLCIPITRGTETRVSLRLQAPEKYLDEHPVRAMGALWRLRLADICPDPYAFQRSLRAPRVVWFRRGGIVGYVTPTRTILRDRP